MSRLIRSSAARSALAHAVLAPAVLALTLVLAPAAALADPYAAVSTTAMGITGDIDMDDFGITFENGARLDFSDLVGDSFQVDGKTRPASVYAVKDPANPELNGGNTLCDGDVTYMASWLDDATQMTILAAFTTQDVPASNEEMCASFSYEAK